MTTYSDDTMELALALWPQYTRETLPPQIYTAVANRVVREQREEQEERDGTAERRRAARLAVIQEHEEQQARATEWEQRHPRPSPETCPALLASQTSGARRMGYRMLADDIRARAMDEGYPGNLACQEYRVLLWKEDRWDAAVGLEDC